MIEHVEWLIVALATSSKQLKVLRAGINWGLPTTEKQVPLAGLPLNPTLEARRIAITSWFQPGPTQSNLDTSMAQLSHLEVLPPALKGPPGSNQVLFPPTVLAVRSHAAVEHSPYNQDQQSILDRWEILNEEPQSLNPAFEQLGPKAGQTSTPVSPYRYSSFSFFFFFGSSAYMTSAKPLHAHPRTLHSQTMSRLRKLDSIVIPKIIISIHPIHLGTVIVFAFSDGTIQYRDRFTMNEVFNEPNINRIMTLSQVGFQFTEETPCKAGPATFYTVTHGTCLLQGLINANTFLSPLPPISRPSSCSVTYLLLLRANMRG